MLTEAYGNETLSPAHLFEWHKRFSGGRDSVEVDEHAGRPRELPFTSVEEVQAKTENLPKGLPKTSFQNCKQE
ncbi:hypothetical protein TNCV_827001 [Trichonephila clavipes]|nr:hypothetical protein TNCV_827001 [Trichonephila clavipes]